ncbi:unnamed protein product [Prorocentrum cordatum]|uniref:Uncharacterized protein n=1 Tax=Prorocentrum cordatum TaxID=2364126 RepID=A0ABN9UNX9_9DINO|nr:unnamed protein product [Polarella glacialis]
MTKLLVSNKQLKPLGELRADLGARLRRARKISSIFDSKDLVAWEAVVHDGMVTISLAYAIFSMKYTFAAMKGNKKLKVAAEKLKQDLQAKGAWAHVPARVVAAIEGGGKVLEVGPDEGARSAFLVVHAAAGLAVRAPAGGRDAVRLLRAAEGLLRTAVAALAAPPPAPAPPVEAADVQPMLGRCGSRGSEGKGTGKGGEFVDKNKLVHLEVWQLRELVIRLGERAGLPRPASEVPFDHGVLLAMAVELEELAVVSDGARGGGSGAEHAIECACELLNAIGFTLESLPAGRAALSAVCGRMHALRYAKTESGKQAYSKRVQFTIQDILDARAADWTRKSFKTSAKTKEDIRLEQERDLHARSNGAEGETVVAGQRPIYLTAAGIGLGIGA